jgi:TatD DNase family protein
MWVDSHCHLESDDEVAAARAAGVGRLITIGTDAEQSRVAVDFASRHAEVWATVGLHPHDAKHGVDSIVPLLASPRVVAVGECGLDYHYDHSPRDVQRAAFAAQIGLAHERGLALVIHTREAWDDTFDILAAEGMPARTVFHCFTGGEAEASRALDQGAYLSFSGIVTFKKAAEVRAAAVRCPLNRLLLETDSPYLAPEPLRGRRNTPANLPLVGAGTAECKSVEPEQVRAAAEANTRAVFELPESVTLL